MPKGVYDVDKIDKYTLQVPRYMKQERDNKPRVVAKHYLHLGTPR